MRKVTPAAVPGTPDLLSLYISVAVYKTLCFKLFSSVQARCSQSYATSHSLENNEYVKQFFSPNCNHQEIKFCQHYKKCHLLQTIKDSFHVGTIKNIYKFTPQKLC